MTKKIIALLLALVMIVGVLPLTALADQGADDPQGQGVVEEQKDPEENKDPENQNGPEENKDPENKNGPEENKDPENQNGLEENKDPENQNGLEENKDPENQKDPEDNKDTENQKDSEDNKDPENQEITNKFKSVSATVKATLGGIMPYASNSTVVLHPSTGTTPTGFKVSVGSTINGYTVTKLNSSNYEITIDLGTYNVSLMIFRIPLPEEVWSGVKMQYNPQTYVSAGTSGAVQKTPGSSALLGNGKNTFYYYNLGPDSSGGSDSYLWNFTLKFDANGGTGAPAPLTYGTNDKYTKSHSFTIPSTQPTREGYTFKGWSKTSTGTVNYQPGGTCLVSQTASGYNGGSVTVTLYAVWEKDAPTPPSRPNPAQVEALLKEAVKIDCVNADVEHADKTYALISGTYSIGTVQGNATDGYTSVVTVLKKYAGQYVSKYNSEIGVDHSLDPADQTDQTITLEYKDNAWTVQAGSAPVTFTVKCATPPTEEPVDWTKLTISKTVNKTTANPGDTITYTITVTNNTGKDLRNITVSDPLDSNLTFVSAAPDDQYDSTKQVWTIPTLANGASATLTITATVNSDVADGTKITNIATITTVDDGGDALQTINKPSNSVDVDVTKPTPAVTGITKEVVTAAPTDVTVPTGVTYPTGNSVIVDNGTTSVTLLYKVTVKGDADAAYNVSDEGATCITNNATGTIPEGGEVVLYFTKTFTDLSTGDNTASNTASLVGTNYTDVVDVTITVKPAKPTDDELETLLAGAVGVTCTNESAEHGSKTSKTYNLLPDSYTIGDVTSVGDGIFTCTITVYADDYVGDYNEYVGYTHVLDDDPYKTIELVYLDKEWVKTAAIAAFSDDEIISPDITFEVVCTTYKLTYDANGGTGAPTDTNAYSHDDAVTLATDPVPTHVINADGDRVVFIGWTASKTSTIYTETDTAPATITSVTFDDSDITVYAAWGVDSNGDGIADVLQRVTLTYDANGGTGAPSSQSGLPGSFTISATKPTRTQYVFMGWATESSATTASYQPEGTISITANTTLYAVWEADLNGNGVPDKNETTYTVTYTDGVIGTKVFDDQVYSGLLSGTKTPAFVGTPTRTGYVFAGWVPAVAETVTENVTYVATWQKVSSSGLDNVPKTGDTSIAMIGGLMLFALYGGTAVYVIDRKKNRA